MGRETPRWGDRAQLIGVAAIAVGLTAMYFDPQLMENLLHIDHLNISDGGTDLTTSSGDHIWVQNGVSGTHIGGSWIHYGQDGIPLHGVIPSEYLHDKWGPIYDQRDIRWGNDLLNGQPGVTSWEQGCYASAYAMLAAHYGVEVNGHLITPADVIQNHAYFVKGTPDMWAQLPISGTTEHVYANTSIAEISQFVQHGDGVIVCLHHSWTSKEPWTTDHFVVATGFVKHQSGELDLIIRDPDSPFGKDFDMGSHYQQADGWHIVGVKDYVSN